ncbi:hypothetical protein PIB30_047721, partial [Stylosanthes scabra]|nr:hypothetical protein [Stylosanthes scabra]
MIVTIKSYYDSLSHDVKKKFDAALVEANRYIDITPDWVSKVWKSDRLQRYFTEGGKLNTSTPDKCMVFF